MAAAISSTALERSRYAAVPSAKWAVNMAETYCPSWPKSVMANSTQPMMKAKTVYTWPTHLGALSSHRSRKIFSRISNTA